MIHLLTSEMILPPQQAESIESPAENYSFKTISMSEGLKIIVRPNHYLYSGSEFLITYLGFYSHLLIWLFTPRGLIVMCASESSHDLLRWLYHGKRNFERKGGWDGSNHGVFEKKYLSKTRLLFGTNPNQRTKDSHTYKMVPKKTYKCRALDK